MMYDSNRAPIGFIEGSIRTSSYDDKEGNKRYTTEVIANDDGS